MNDDSQTFAQYNASLPDRSPQWRAERVKQIMDLQGGRWHRQRDDEITIRAARFQAALSTLRRRDIPESEIRLLCLSSPRHRRVSQAYQLSESKMRDVIEARILARQTNEQIASKSSASPEAIGMFEQLFFNVRDRLDDRDYIHATVIGYTAHRGTDSLTHQQKARLLAYETGVSVLERFLYGHSKRQTVVDANTYLDQLIQSNLEIQGVLATHAMSAGKFDVRDVINANITYKQLNQRETSSSQQSDWIQTFVDTLRKRTPIPRGAEAAAIPDDSPLHNYIAGTVELRAAEQLRATSKGGLPYIDALRNFRLRDPGEED